MSSVSLKVLLLINAIPLLGVLFRGWSAQEVLVVYWLENITVGLINVLKLLTNKHETTKRPAVFFLAAFFTVHYGFFTFAHGTFVFSELNGFSSFSPFPAMKQAFIDYRLLFLSFFASHFISFILNYHLKGEAKRLNLGSVMFLPYSRIFVLHLTIILGGIAVTALGSPIILVLTLVLIKTAGDVVLHRREHQKAQTA